MLNDSVADLADPLLTVVAEMVTVCFPVWSPLMSLVYGSMPKPNKCIKSATIYREMSSQTDGVSPSTEHLKLVKSPAFAQETVNCVAVCEELQLKDCTAEKEKIGSCMYTQRLLYLFSLCTRNSKCLSTGGGSSINSNK